MASKNTSGKEKYYWQAKVLLARKNISGKQQFFGKEKYFWRGIQIQEKSGWSDVNSPGAGEFPGAGVDASGGAAVMFIFVRLLSCCYFYVSNIMMITIMF